MSGRLQEIVRAWLGPGARLVDARPLEGGWINEVLEVEVDRAPFKAVVKQPKAVSPPGEVFLCTDTVIPHCSFAEEAAALEYLRRETRLRVPEVYAVGEGERVQSFLVIERLPGVNLEKAEMTADERNPVEVQLADDLLDLHSHRRDAFGLLDERKQAWLDVFEPMIRFNLDTSRPILTAKTGEILDALLRAVPSVFAGGSEPALIHGDAWAGNIMVEPGDRGWRVSGWVDPGLMFADVELELAYLSVFGTGGPAFFERYYASAPPREGHETRRLYYWLNTMLVHAWVFGYPRYVERADELARELARVLEGNSPPAAG